MTYEINGYITFCCVYVNNFLFSWMQPVRSQFFVWIFVCVCELYGPCYQVVTVWFSPDVPVQYTCTYWPKNCFFFYCWCLHPVRSQAIGRHSADQVQCWWQAIKRHRANHLSECSTKVSITICIELDIFFLFHAYEPDIRWVWECPGLLRARPSKDISLSPNWLFFCQGFIVHIYSDGHCRPCFMHVNLLFVSGCHCTVGYQGHC